MYDALDTYKRKSAMPRLAAKELKLGDVVLLEVFITRWIPKDDPQLDDATPSGSAGSSAKGKGVYRKGRWTKKEWKKWNVQFTLDAISLIYPGSDYYMDEAKADEEVEI